MQLGVYAWLGRHVKIIILGIVIVLVVALIRHERFALSVESSSISIRMEAG